MSLSKGSLMDIGRMRIL